MMELLTEFVVDRHVLENHGVFHSVDASVGGADVALSSGLLHRKDSASLLGQF